MMRSPLARGMLTFAGSLLVGWTAMTCIDSTSFAQRRAADRYDEIVDAFIAYDVGELRGQAGANAFAAFNNMNQDEAIPAVVRGVNKAAKINNSCPIIVLANKLQGMLASTKNKEMVAYALDNLDDKQEGAVYGSYVTSMRQFADARYAQMTGGKPRIGKQQLRGGGTASQLRRSQISVDEWSYEDLVEALGQEKEAALVEVLEQLRERKGAQYTAALTDAVLVVPDEMKPVARGLLAQRFVRMTDDTLVAYLKHENPEVRAAAARAIGYKESPLWNELAVAMRDRESEVSRFALDSLVKLTGQNLGPPPDTTSLAAWFAASQKWEAWIAEHPPASDAPRRE